MVLTPWAAGLLQRAVSSFWALFVPPRRPWCRGARLAPRVCDWNTELAPRALWCAGGRGCPPAGRGTSRMRAAPWKRLLRAWASEQSILTGRTFLPSSAELFTLTATFSFVFSCLRADTLYAFLLFFLAHFAPVPPEIRRDRRVQAVGDGAEAGPHRRPRHVGHDHLPS